MTNETAWPPDARVVAWHGSLVRRTQSRDDTVRAPCRPAARSSPKPCARNESAPATWTRRVSLDPLHAAGTGSLANDPVPERRRRIRPKLFRSRCVSRVQIEYESSQERSSRGTESGHQADWVARPLRRVSRGSTSTLHVGNL